MAIDPNLRASDSDREAVAQQLRDHYAAGRITLDEFDERTTITYAAKTFGDLDGLLADLPSTVVVPVPDARVPVPSPPSGADKVDRFRAAIAPFTTWIVVAMVTNLIWLGNAGPHGHGHMPYWPLWVIGPWGVMIVMRWLQGGSRQQSEMERRRAEHEARQRAIRDNRRAS
ncbi:MAG TPA: DUF1707 domain-containing protein [Actinopolymorphaceae bacterium]|jgi:hypothetical protein